MSNQFDLLNRRIYEVVLRSGSSGVVTNQVFENLHREKEYWRMLEMVEGNLLTSTAEKTGKVRPKEAVLCHLCQY